MNKRRQREGQLGWKEGKGWAMGHSLPKTEGSEWNHVVVGNMFVDFLFESGIDK